jgi:hypothetical protein
MRRPSDINRKKGRGAEIDVDLVNIARFDRYVDRSDESGCWMWKGRADKGYGRFSVQQNGRQYLIQAHRVAYALYTSAIPAGLEIDHLCRNKLCVNPAHLEAVTPQLNTSRNLGATANAVTAWIDGRCLNGHDLNKVGLHKAGSAFTCAQCGRDRVAKYRARKGRAS